MERGDRRLLNHLDLMGRVTAERPSAHERLEKELGPGMLRLLLPDAYLRSATAATTHGSRHVA
jgi:hypothetical protein